MPDKDAIRTDMERTRSEYHALLRSLTGDDWARRSGNPDMTVKDLMWHMAWAMSWMARSIDAVKAGKGLNPPGPLVDPLRKLAMRWLARKATPESAAKKYDEGHAALLAKLDAVRADDWQLEVSRFGQMRSVEWYFRNVREHFEEHSSDVRAVVGPRKSNVDD